MYMYNLTAFKDGNKELKEGNVSSVSSNIIIIKMIARWTTS